MSRDYFFGKISDLKTYERVLGEIARTRNKLGYDGHSFVCPKLGNLNHFETSTFDVCPLDSDVRLDLESKLYSLASIDRTGGDDTTGDEYLWGRSEWGAYNGIRFGPRSDAYTDLNKRFLGFSKFISDHALGDFVEVSEENSCISVRATGGAISFADRKNCGSEQLVLRIANAFKGATDLIVYNRTPEDCEAGARTYLSDQEGVSVSYYGGMSSYLEDRDRFSLSSRGPWRFNLFGVASKTVSFDQIELGSVCPGGKTKKGIWIDFLGTSSGVVAMLTPEDDDGRDRSRELSKLITKLALEEVVCS